MADIMGIDYGARKAGTTAFCIISQDELIVEQSIKNKDADDFLMLAVQTYAPKLICIDAPLSLPMVYTITDSESRDYHYRTCDREAGAMSPMFLGGLTARAMEISASWKASGIEVLEVYPGGLVKHLGLEQHYKTDVVKFLEDVHSSVEMTVLPAVQSWHQIDAILACISGIRFTEGRNITLGEEKEGLIII